MVLRLDQFKKKDPPEKQGYPEWVQSTTTKKLYETALEHYKIIQEKINNKEPLAIRERNIISRKIAQQCSVSPSIINARRQGSLVRFINELNNELNLMYTSLLTKTSRSGKKLTRNELIIENRLLHAENNRISNLKMAEALTKTIESLLTEQCKTQAITIQKLREQIHRMDFVISEQALLNQRYIDSTT